MKDGNLVMDYNMGGMKASMELSVTERKVTGKESVTSPTGTWECFTITSLQKVNYKNCRGWYSHEIGSNRMVCARSWG